jgi:hypothetical protein
VPLDRAMLAPPAGAGADRVIVQFADSEAVIVLGVHVRDEGTVSDVKLIVAVCCWASSVAVTVTLSALLTVPVVALNPPLLWPAAIITLAGTVSAGALLVIAIAIALAAAPLSDTVQLLEALLPKVEGVQDIEVSWAVTATERVNCAVPL